jgi:type VI secretion system secreted protein VgrG
MCTSETTSRVPTVEREARTRLDAERAGAETLLATSVFAHLSPGQVIELEDGPARAAEQVVAEIAHEGRVVEAANELSYRARVVFVPAAVPLRPTLTERAPVHGLDAATVVGPPGKEIHTDEHGRVQVRFRWDDASDVPVAWLQVAQPWSGAGYGSSWLPRVGSEVLVSYLGGHPDRPIVIGSLHHPLSPSPIRHPHEAHQVGIRTRSTPGGEGASELIFDDLAGSERVSLRSSRQLDLSALGNTSVRTTGATEHVTGQSWKQEVGGSALAQIGGDLDQVVAGSTHERIGGDQRLEIRGAEQRAVGGSSQESIGGMHTVVVAAGRHTSIGVGEIGGDERLSASRHVHIAAGKELELRAKDRLTLRCGDSSIVMTPSGIRIHSARVEIHTDESTELSHGARAAVGFAYDGAFAFAAETITLASKAGASLVLDADAKLDGALVMLNCGGAGGRRGPGGRRRRRGSGVRARPSGPPAGRGSHLRDRRARRRAPRARGAARRRDPPARAAGGALRVGGSSVRGRRVRTRNRESGEG